LEADSAASLAEMAERLHIRLCFPWIDLEPLVFFVGKYVDKMYRQEYKKGTHISFDGAYERVD
jgi:hypothetical protein